MSEDSTIKVYELAKELETDSLSLLDKLKDLGVSVKSHMSSINETQANLAREKLQAKPKTKAKASKKKATKKVVRKRTTAAPKTTATKTKSATSKTSKKEETKSSSSKSSVIRRRVHADGSRETLTKAKKEPSAESQAQKPSISESDSTLSTESAAQTESAQVKSSILKAKPAEPKSVLSIIKQKAPKKPVITRAPEKPAPQKSETEDDGFRVFKVNKEALDLLAEEEAKKKKGGGLKPPKPEDVRFADYRKKEVVFLPKRKKIPVGKELKKTKITTPSARKRVIQFSESMTVGELAEGLGRKAGELIRKLMQMGQTATINQSLDLDTVTLLAGEYQFEVKDATFNEEDVFKREDAPESLKERPPIVTIMGHVDHGKTSLLDAIKKSNVVDSEAGGITQHIGAYTVEQNGKLITFIDTPGHEAFTAMRARGANITDLVILVVAADDGVMPQTREAVNHAKAANVPIVVAVNKMDVQGANPEKVKQSLAELDLLAEDWGGQTMFVPVSAKEKTNLDKLLEAILLNSEVMELKANPDAEADGTVLEAKLEKGRGPVVSLLVTRGTLKVGDLVVSGVYAGRIRALMNHLGQQVKEVGPGMAAEALGLEGVPEAGEAFYVVQSDQQLRSIVSHRQEKLRRQNARTSGAMSLDELFAHVQTGNLKSLNVVLKADVYGSLEAVKEALIKTSTEKVKVNVIHAATGGISESDVLLASASNALIVGFNVRPETNARRTAESKGIDIKCYRIIYELIDEIKNAMSGLLDKKKIERFLGRAEVRQTFSVPKIGVIAGTSVIDGKMLRGAHVRLLRESKVIYDGKMSSLKRFKEDAKEVQSGYECGIGLEEYNDIKTGDIIEAYQIDLVNQELSDQ